MSTDDQIKNTPSRHPNKEPFLNFINQIDQLFSGKNAGMLQSLDNFFHNSSIRSTFPIEMKEEQNHYMVKAKLPGVNKQQINMEILGQSLLISVHHHEIINYEEGSKTYQTQQTYHTVKRSVTFVKPINEHGIKASFNEGLLEIIVPKIRGKEIKMVKNR